MGKFCACQKVVYSNTPALHSIAPGGEANGVGGDGEKVGKTQEKVRLVGIESAAAFVHYGKLTLLLLYVLCLLLLQGAPELRSFTGIVY